MSPLTPHERQVLQHVATGLSDVQIAQLMILSVFTVKSYVKRLLRLSQMRNRVQLAVWAVKNRLV